MPYFTIRFSRVSRVRPAVRPTPHDSTPPTRSRHFRSCIKTRQKNPAIKKTKKTSWSSSFPHILSADRGKYLGGGGADGAAHGGSLEGDQTSSGDGRHGSKRLKRCVSARGGGCKNVAHPQVVLGYQVINPGHGDAHGTRIDKSPTGLPANGGSLFAPRSATVYPSPTLIFQSFRWRRKNRACRQ